tara:strand:- start:203 stop:415 length:213 start_codon:yes stop_codon:yes gene_type:complete
MKFKNNQNIDVYVDLGTLKRVAPGEIVDLPGAMKCEGLAPMLEEKPVPPTKAPKKKVVKPTKNVGTSGTI